jgi:hypothetical protein
MSLLMPQTAISLAGAAYTSISYAVGDSNFNTNHFYTIYATGTWNGATLKVAVSGDSVFTLDSASTWYDVAASTLTSNGYASFNVRAAKMRFYTSGGNSSTAIALTIC